MTEVNSCYIRNGKESKVSSSVQSLQWITLKSTQYRGAFPESFDKAAIRFVDTLARTPLYNIFREGKEIIFYRPKHENSLLVKRFKL